MEQGNRNAPIPMVYNNPEFEHLGDSGIFPPGGGDSINRSFLDTPLELSCIESSNSGAGDSFFPAAPESPIPFTDADEKMLQELDEGKFDGGEFDDREFIPAEFAPTSTPKRRRVVADLEDGKYLYDVVLRDESGTSGGYEGGQQLGESSGKGSSGRREEEQQAGETSEPGDREELQARENQ